MNAKQAYNKLMSILADGTMCALVGLWFDGNNSTPSSDGEIVFRALVGVEDSQARRALLNIERETCDLEDNFVGWAHVLVMFAGPADADTGTGVYVNETRLVGIDGATEQPNATPIVDEPIPF